MNFQIVEVCADGFAPVLDPDTLKPILYPDGGLAAECCRQMANTTGKKYQPRPVADTEWRERERNRFADGTYKVLPWWNESWWQGSDYANTHYAHVSVRRPGMVAFTDSTERGERDIQTAMRAGRYLQRFFGSVLTESDIKRQASKFAKANEENVLLFAISEDEIDDVYRSGPTSCMGGESVDYPDYRESQGYRWRSPFPAVRVYAGDLQVAYLVGSGRVTARSLVWPAKKTHSRVYGRDDGWRYKLEELLADAGYKFGLPIGAKLKRVEHHSTFVCPYIDAGKGVGAGALGISDNGKHLVICGYGEGDFTAENIDGLAAESERSDTCCASCGEYYDDDDLHRVQDEGDWCENCCDNHTFVCDETGRRYSDSEDQYETVDGNTWGPDAYRRHGATCSITDVVDYRSHFISMSNGELWHQSHFDDHGFTCDSCLQGEDQELRTVMPHGEYCARCTERYAVTCTDCTTTIDKMVHVHDCVQHEYVCHPCAYQRTLRYLSIFSRTQVKA